MPERMTRELVERAMHGDAEAFGALAQARLDRLVGAAGLILRDADAADDAVQDALVRAWRDLPKLRDADRFDAWLRRILVRSCNDQLRHRTRARHDQLSDDLATWPNSPLEDRDELTTALARLADEHRTVVVLHYYLGLSQQQIAETLGTRVGTVKSRLSRAMDYLRAELDASARGRPARQEVS
jgi:RNA polymerase sigma-70 factor (ECF subfamily)